MRLVAAGEVQAELLQELLQLLELLGRRPFVDTVERGMLVTLQEVGGADVGREHAFLDQAVGVVALDRDDALDLALVIEDDLRLDGLEVDGAAPHPRLDENPE